MRTLRSTWPGAAVAQIFNLLSRRFPIGRPSAFSTRVPFGNRGRLKSARSRSRLATSGFSLLEMMVAVTLLLLIITALLTMFYQVQRAFRQSVTQVDVLEGGRAGMELLAAELPEITPSQRPGQINLYAETMFPFLIQPRPAPAAPRINVLQDIFFLRQQNDQWIGTGYFVVPTSTEAVGTLYRFETNFPSADVSGFFGAFEYAVKRFPTPFTHRVIDRVVSLRLTPYDFQGQYLTNLVDLNYSFPSSFTNNALPSYLDLELGILEPRAFESYRSLTNNSARAQAYLQNHVEKVHLFRQRIPIRSATIAQ
jgi:prepilin-type N-terminal cleavage/methylation domain-containing protein